MGRTVVVLSGSIASGKSTLADGLRVRYGAHHLRTQDLLRARAASEGRGKLRDRRALQQYGEELDQRTEGRWVAEDLGPIVASLPDRSVVVVDAIRILKQLDALHVAFGRRISHVHLTADLDQRARRYADRQRVPGGIDELADYAQVQQDPTESRVPELAADADLVIDTGSTPHAGALLRCAARLGLLPSVGEQLVDVVVGAQYGSEGKGNVCFYLAPEYDVLVRVGGPNAGHKVPTDPPYTHRLLPSGSLSNTAALLLLGPGAVLNVDVLLREISECRVNADRLRIDPQAMIIEAEDIEAEKAALGTIGSTRQGVGQATARRVNGRGSYPAGVRLARDVPDLRPYTSATAREVLDDSYRTGRRILLEGTQGTDLSLYHGDYPHVTSRDTTAAGCLAEAGISPRRVRRIVMVTRTRPIRVGGPSGPMTDERTLGEIAAAAGLPESDLAQREIGSVSNTARRIAEFDWEQLRRAAELNGATDIALTFADYLDATNRGVHRFDQLTQQTIGFIDDVEHVAGCRVSLVSTDFGRRGLLDRRDWRGHVLDPAPDEDHAQEETGY